ncbi:hypothetical protein VNO77_16093 [Canavalia gladiata]|uniref:Uncharacterized protein n=1 Tax=Canavalia gladiata TaxID=3824 RepID=A0AAN9M3I9_CANGL
MQGIKNILFPVSHLFLKQLQIQNMLRAINVPGLLFNTSNRYAENPLGWAPVRSIEQGWPMVQYWYRPFWALQIEPLLLSGTEQFVLPKLPLLESIVTMDGAEEMRAVGVSAEISLLWMCSVRR